VCLNLIIWFNNIFPVRNQEYLPLINSMIIRKFIIPQHWSWNFFRFQVHFNQFRKDPNFNWVSTRYKCIFINAVWLSERLEADWILHNAFKEEWFWDVRFYISNKCILHVKRFENNWMNAFYFCFDVIFGYKIWHECESVLRYSTKHNYKKEWYLDIPEF
jgi:hypothetical protein